MKNEIKPSGTLLVGLLKSGGEIELLKPFEREIFLFDTYVAGTGYIEGIDELEPYLKQGDRLDFFRESDNPHDQDAIVIKNENGVKIGYVPKGDNVVFSRLMDAGKLIFGKIDNKKYKGEWLKIDIKIYLKD